MIVHHLQYIVYLYSKYITVLHINLYFNLWLEGMAVHQMHVSFGLNPTNCHHTGGQPVTKQG